MKSIHEMNDQEAYDYLSKSKSEMLFKKHTPDEISKLIDKAKNMSKVKRPIPPKTMDVKSTRPKPFVPPDKQEGSVTKLPPPSHHYHTSVSPEGKKVEYAGIVQTVKNFGEAVARNIKSGGKMVSDDIYNKRMSICKSCPHWDAKFGRCRICGCLSGKMRLAAEKCPDNPPRWKSEY